MTVQYYFDEHGKRMEAGRRIDELLKANNEYRERAITAEKKLADVIDANKILERTLVQIAVDTTLSTLVEREDDGYIPLNGR